MQTTIELCQRKDSDITEMLAYLRKKFNLATDTDALRYCLQQQISMERVLDDGMWVQFLDQEGKVRGLLFQ